MITLKFDDEQTLEEQDRERIITKLDLTDPSGLVSIPLVKGYVMTEYDLVILECPLCGGRHTHLNHDYQIGDIIIQDTNCNKELKFVRKYEVYCIEVVGEIDPKKFRKFMNRKENKKRVIAGHIPRFYVRI